MVKSVAPKAPSAAASVGDAIPAKIDPNTASTRKKGSKNAVIILFILTMPVNFSSSSAGIAGTDFGLIKVRITIQIKYKNTSNNPGITAPINKLPTGTFNTLPSNTKIILGGIICPSVPEAIITPLAARG